MLLLFLRVPKFFRWNTHPPAFSHPNPSTLPSPPLSHHEKRVSDPQTAPAYRARRNGGVLAVHGDGHRGCLAHRAAADVLLDLLALHRHHGNGCRGGQPIGLVIAVGVATQVVGVAVEEGHGVETRDAGARQT